MVDCVYDCTITSRYASMTSMEKLGSPELSVVPSVFHANPEDAD